MKEKKQQIKIKPENVGSFTSYCNRKGHNGVTNSCIQSGLASPLAKIRKKAQFALNSRKWNKGNRS